jgi:DNA-directed RNA polymerase subunit E'/Rpb7
MALQNIFVDLKLHDIIHLYPWQLNNELYLNLKKNLKIKTEKKCVDAGYICKINNIEEYDGYIIPEDLSGNVTFKVTYTAKVCIPLPGYQIIMKVEQIIKQAIMATNGPIAGIIKFTDTNNNIFFTNDSNELINKKTNKPLKIGDYVRVTIKSKRSFIGETRIGILGFINDIASDDEVKNNMYIDFDDNDDIITKNNIVIEVNDDEDEIDTFDNTQNMTSLSAYTMEI